MEEFLSERQQEQATLIIEECSEVIKAVTKIQRFGKVAIDPSTGTKYENLSELSIELGNLLAVISLSDFWHEGEQPLVDHQQMQTSRRAHLIKLGRYTKHQTKMPF